MDCYCFYLATPHHQLDIHTEVVVLLIETDEINMNLYVERPLLWWHMTTTARRTSSSSLWNWDICSWHIQLSLSRFHCHPQRGEKIWNNLAMQGYKSLLAVNWPLGDSDKATASTVSIFHLWISPASHHDQDVRANSGVYFEQVYL